MPKRIQRRSDAGWRRPEGASGRFGPVSATDMLAAFVVGHAVHDRAGMPNGLTATGKPRKTAVAAFKAAMRGEGAGRDG